MHNVSSINEVIAQYYRLEAETKSMSPPKEFAVTQAYFVNGRHVRSDIVGKGVLQENGDFKISSEGYLTFVGKLSDIRIFGHVLQIGYDPKFSKNIREANFGATFMMSVSIEVPRTPKVEGN